MVVAWVIKFTKIVQENLNKAPQTQILVVEDLKEAEAVISFVRKKELKDTGKILSKVKTSEEVGERTWVFESING